MKTEQYFKDSELSVDVFKKKYRKDNEEYHDAIKQIVEKVAMMECYNSKNGKIQNTKENIALESMFKNKWFKEIINNIWHPAGSIVSAVGNNIKNISSYNCTTIGLEGDTLEDIAMARYKLLKFAAFRQGLGIDFSNLRPSGAIVNNSAKISTGALNWMEDFNEAANHIGQAGRIPALLFSLKSEHPDFPEFITIKSDLKKIMNANISGQISDEFMQAVENDEEWVMEFSTKHEIVTRKESARELYNKILDNNLKFAEPGSQFIDTIKKYSNSDYVGWPVVSSNACFTDDMKLLTSNGYVKFIDLTDQKVSLINKDGLQTRGKVWYVGVKHVVEFGVKAGTMYKSFKTTPDQVWMLNDRSKCRADDLKGKRLMPNVNGVDKGNLDNDFIAMGFMQGDACLERLKDGSRHNGIEVIIGEKDINILELFPNHDIQQSDGTKKYLYVTKYTEILKRLGFDSNNLPDRKLPATYWSWDYNQKRSFLRGLFSANGYVINSENYRIGLKSTNKNFLNQLVNSLKNDFGINTYITTNKPKKIKWHNGEYISKESHDLNIGKYYDKIHFHNTIGFVHKYKNENSAKGLIELSPKINYIKPLGKLAVYDFSEPISNWGVVGGFIAHNCSEKFLDPSGACNLASFNLGKLPKIWNGIDKMLEKHIPSMVRFLDNVIDVEEYEKRSPIKDQYISQKNLRRLGIGITNIHAWLLKMNCEYGSSESVKLVDELMKRIMYYAYKTSIELGENKGSFLAFNRKRFEQSPYVKKMIDMGLEFKTMRNVELISIAPTGTLSTMFSKPVMSYGIEPAFGLYYWKRTRISGEYEYYFIVPDIVYSILKDNGIDLKQHGLTKLVVKDTFDGKIGKPIVKIIEKNKHFFSFKPAKDIDPIDKVNLMAAAAQWVDSSISTTYILPESASVKDADDIFMQSWKSKIKSVAVYRDATRYGIVEFIPFKERVEELYKQGFILNSNELSKKDLKMLKFNPFEDKKYSKVLNSNGRYFNKHKFTAEGSDKFYVLLSDDEKQIFIINYKIENRSSEKILSIANRLGSLVKDINMDIYYKQLERSDNSLSRFTRMLSTCLKHNMKTEALNILDEYAMVGNLAWYLVRRVFKYSLSQKICSNCKSKNIVPKSDGCWICQNCGSEKCE